MKVFKNTEYLLNVAGVICISILLVAAFVIQIAYHELPCPLCLLQRIGFMLIGLGFLFNVRFGLRPNHYSIILLGAIFTGAVALRQILLHIVPGTGSYGSAIFGLHLYTWSFLVVLMIISTTAILLGWERQYETTCHYFNTYKKPIIALIICFLLIGIANIVDIWAQCGWKDCPDNPVTYMHALL